MGWEGKTKINCENIVSKFLVQQINKFSDFYILEVYSIICRVSHFSILFQPPVFHPLLIPFSNSHKRRVHTNFQDDWFGRIYLCKDFSCAPTGQIFSIHLYARRKNRKRRCKQKHAARSHSSLFSTRERENAKEAAFLFLYTGSIKWRNSLPSVRESEESNNCCMQIIRRLAF